MATATIVLIVLTGWEIFPEWPTVGLLAGVLTAFNPQFLFVSGAINNDNLLTLATTGLVWQMMRTLRSLEAWRNWLWLGLWTTVAALAKISGLVLLAWTGIILLIDSIRRRAWMDFGRRLAALVIPVAVGTGWWFVRNQQLYGDPLGWNTYRSIFTNNARVTPLSGAEVQNFFVTQFRSFWASFGWINIDAPAWFYISVTILCGAGVVGLALFLVIRAPGLARPKQAALVCLGLLILLYEAYMLWSIQQFDGSWYQGRYIFGLMAPLNILFSLGLHTLIGFRRPQILVGAVTAVMLVVAIYLPVYVIRPLYGL
jgi:4-amino-4-deoxy-L-arabinose transferase-like glycosyltransferase